jgi:uncharacterized protein (TIGR02453 family)
MPAALNLEPVLGFLDELAQNNNKAWFDSHRPAYTTARATFERFIDDIIDEFRTSDHLQDLAAKHCMARIYRDVRFSKDKSPYKTNFGAMIAPGGWKTTALGYFVSVAPQGQSMVAGGLYDPTPEQLNRFRQAIDEDATTFKKVTAARDFVATFGEVEGDRLKTAPKGYDRAHPDIALLQLKQITVIHRFSDPAVLAPTFADQVAIACRAMKPFLAYLSGAVQ